MKNAEIYAGEDEILNYKSKIVKTRKTHICLVKEIVQGENV